MAALGIYSRSCYSLAYLREESKLRFNKIGHELFVLLTGKEEIRDDGASKCQTNKCDY